MTRYYEVFVWCHVTNTSLSICLCEVTKHTAIQFPLPGHTCIPTRFDVDANKTVAENRLEVLENWWNMTSG